MIFAKVKVGLRVVSDILVNILEWKSVLLLGEFTPFYTDFIGQLCNTSPNHA